MGGPQVSIPGRLGLEGHGSILRRNHPDAEKDCGDGNPGRARQSALFRRFIPIRIGHLPQAAGAGGQDDRRHHATGHIPNEIGRRVNGTGDQDGRDAREAQCDPLLPAAGAESRHAPPDAQPDRDSQQEQAGDPRFEADLQVTVFGMRIFLGLRVLVRGQVPRVDFDMASQSRARREVGHGFKVGLPDLAPSVPLIQFIDRPEIFQPSGHGLVAVDQQAR